MTTIENIVSEAEWIVYCRKTGVNQRFVNQKQCFTSVADICPAIFKDFICNKQKFI
jgi:hypothetical protein